MQRESRCTQPAASHICWMSNNYNFPGGRQYKNSHKTFYCVSDTGYYSQQSESYPEDRAALPINVEQMASLSLKSLSVTMEMLGFIPEEL